MVEQYTENQYDDDLTGGSGEYDDSYYTGAEDLFDYTPDDESPISRLKSLVLSIDWEITDDVLLDFNEELVDLKDIWAGEKINLVYVQALEKLSKYIYQKKADSHPSAIKLLLTLYHNLEKIVSSDDLSDAEKKKILLEDVKRFENLKSHLKTPKKPKAGIAEVESKAVLPEVTASKNSGGEAELLNLKAIVLGIDWEITDEDLSALRQEVVRLEKLFSGSRPRLILLQGIGTIGAYIKVKKSDSHADAFKVLHLFYESLEKIVATPMSVEQEKAILFPAVEKFNAFKTLLGETISPESIHRSEKNDEQEEAGYPADAVTPAFSDLPEGEVIGFQADKEAAALGIDNPDKVIDHVANFFGEDSFLDEREPADQLKGALESQFAETPLSTSEVVDKDIALQGVDVEEGDEDDEPAGLTVDVPGEGDLAPALSFEDDPTEGSPVAQLSDSLDDTPPAGVLESEGGDGESSVEVTFPDDDEDNIVADFSGIDKNIALQGVDVESEADDDSGEDALPLLGGGELAPALADNDEVSIYNAETLAGIVEKEGLDDEIAGTVLDFFEEGDVEPESVEVEEEEVRLEPEADAIAVLSGALEDNVDEDLPAGSDNEVSASPEEDKEDEVFSSDIEGQLDDFFGSDEGDSNDPSGGMFTSVDLNEESDKSAPAIAEDVDEEEVVFELVDESLLPGSVLGAVGAVDEKVETNTTLDRLAHCIDTAGLESEDTVLIGLFDEINAIEEQWADKPLEKTFLHLLRTIGRYMNRYRCGAGSKAYELLKSVFDALVLSQTAVDQGQDLLLAQTVRVLDWQQEIIEDEAEELKKG